MSEQRRRLILVSNRGPVTFNADGSVQRGTGGLVTALSGLAWSAASLVAGVVYAFVPWRLAQLPHVQFQWAAFLALLLLFPDCVQ